MTRGGTKHAHRRSNFQAHLSRYPGTEYRQKSGEYEPAPGSLGKRGTPEMTPTKILTIAVAVSALSLSACSKDFSDVQLDEAKMTATGAMAWSHADRPQIVDLDESYNYKFAELPTSGEANQIPWAGDYWATYKDSINQKVVGHDKSPAQKFGEAFGRDNAEDGVSLSYGIDSRPMADLCTSDDDCESKNGVATTCAKRDGEDKGYCIETWTGICHAWAPAAILEKEPETPRYKERR